MTLMKRTAILALGLLSAAICNAADPSTEHTFRLADGEERPAATLEDATWLVGSWTGSGFDQQFEEVWNPASAGSMVGMFKLFGENGVSFYELMLLEVQDDTLSLKVKHFNADFGAWEDKPEFVNFRLVKIEQDALHFGGLSFYRRGDDQIDAYIVLREGDDLTEYHLEYKRDH